VKSANGARRHVASRFDCPWQVLRQPVVFALAIAGSDFNPRAFDGNRARWTQQAFTWCADSPWQIVLLFRQLAFYYTTRLHLRLAANVFKVLSSCLDFLTSTLRISLSQTFRIIASPAKPFERTSPLSRLELDYCPWVLRLSLQRITRPHQTTWHPISSSFV
jgi:hypothetical protein